MPLTAVDAPLPVVTTASGTLTAFDLSAVLRVAVIRNVAESPSSTLSSSPSPTRVDLSVISGSSLSFRSMVAPFTVNPVKLPLTTMVSLVPSSIVSSAGSIMRAGGAAA